MARYSRSLIGKYALIGSTCDTVVSSVVGPTRSPIWALAMAAMPSISEVIRVKRRFSSALSTAASAEACAACAVSRALRSLSS